jgi:hypothetical protein
MGFDNEWTNIQPMNAQNDGWDKFIVFCLFLTVLVAKWPALAIPYHWDEMDVYFAPAHWLSNRSLLDVLPWRHPAELFYGHTPLLYLLTAFLFKLFGTKPEVAHSLVLFFASLGVVYTYRLGRTMASHRVALGGAILLFAFPLYFAQAAMLLPEVPITALGVMSVYYLVARKPVAYSFCSTAMVLIKETSALMVLVLLIFKYTEEVGWRNWRILFPYAVPLVVLTIFFAGQIVTYGALLPNPYFYHQKLISFRGGDAIYWAFDAQWRFLLTGTIIIAHWRTRRLPPIFMLFVTVCLVYVVVFTCIFVLPRYMLMVAPFVCLMAAFSLQLLLPESRRYCIGIALPVLLAIMVPPYERNNSVSCEINMQYRRLVKANMAVAEALSTIPSEKTILASWPLITVLTRPELGYVHRALPVTDDVSAKWEFAVVSEFGDKNLYNEISEVVHQRGGLLVKTVGCNGKQIDIYQLLKR